MSSFSGSGPNRICCDLAHQRPDLRQPLGVEVVPVREVEAGPLEELGRARLRLRLVGQRHRRQVGVAVQDAVVDPQRGGDEVVPGVVLRQGRHGVLEERRVPRRQRRRPVHAVVEPEHAFLVLAPALGEQRRVGVELLPALGAGRRRDVEGAGQPPHAARHRALLRTGWTRCSRSRQGSPRSPDCTGRLLHTVSGRLCSRNSRYPPAGSASIAHSTSCGQP